MPAPRRALLAALAAAPCCVLAVGCGGPGGPDTTTSRAAAPAATECPGSGPATQWLRIDNALNAPISVDTGGVECSEWEGGASPAAMDGMTVGARAAGPARKMGLRGQCGTWTITVSTGAGQVGPVPVRLCRRGSLRVQDDVAWLPAVSVGSVRITGKALGTRSFALTISESA